MSIKIKEMNITTRKTNKEKILDYLKENPIQITTTDLAENTGIDIKNISRYLKQLESEKMVSRKTIQDGKIRVVYITLTSHKKNTTTRNHEGIAKIKPKPKILTKKPLKDEEKLANILSDPTLKPYQIQELIKIYKEIHLEFQANNKLIPLHKKLEIINWLLKDLDNLYEGVYNYLRIWKTRYHKRLIESPESPVIPKFESMKQSLNKIKEIKKLKEEYSLIQNSKKGND